MVIQGEEDQGQDPEQKTKGESDPRGSGSGGHKKDDRKQPPNQIEEKRILFFPFQRPSESDVEFERGQRQEKEKSNPAEQSEVVRSRSDGKRKISESDSAFVGLDKGIDRTKKQNQNKSENGQTFNEPKPLLGHDQ